MEIQNKKLDEGVFMQERQEVLGQWPTGKDVDLQEAADYQKRLSPERVFSTKLLEAKKAGRTLIQPRAGDRGTYQAHAVSGEGGRGRPSAHHD